MANVVENAIESNMNATFTFASSIYDFLLLKPEKLGARKGSFASLFDRSSVSDTHYTYSYVNYTDLGAVSPIKVSLQLDPRDYSHSLNPYIYTYKS